MESDRFAKRSTQKATLPPAQPDEAEIRTYVDGVTYAGPYWYVSLSREDEDATELTFNDAEFEQPLDELPDEMAEDIRELGQDYDSFTWDKPVWDGRFDKMSVVPDAAFEKLSEKFIVVGYDADTELESESWLYDGECPRCGTAVCIEVLDGPDLCYNCGQGVEDDET